MAMWTRNSAEEENLKNPGGNYTFLGIPPPEVGDGNVKMLENLYKTCAKLTFLGLRSAGQCRLRGVGIPRNPYKTCGN